LRKPSVIYPSVDINDNKLEIAFLCCVILVVGLTAVQERRLSDVLQEM
jgi:hypothetical protein